MFVTVYLTSSDATLLQQALTALWLMAIFLPFSYFMDSFMYKRYLGAPANLRRRSASAYRGSARRPAREPARAAASPLTSLETECRSSGSNLNTRSRPGRHAFPARLDLHTAVDHDEHRGLLDLVVAELAALA